jgi:ketosteroid isomerase-like protein
MGTALEALTPLLTAFPTAEAPLTPGDSRAINRLTSAMERLADPALEGAMVGPDTSFRIEFHGAQGLVDSWVDWLSPYESFRMDIEDVIELEDIVVTHVRQFGIPAGGGPELEAEGAAVWWLRDGRLARVEFHLDREAALRAAGVSAA